uniref:Death domain-containing protein n=1 Tax=Strigamia maritima TaxID=126957 RepID=T1J1E4_STRMM
MVLNTAQPDGDDYVAMKQQFCDLFRRFRNESDILRDSKQILTHIIDSSRIAARIITLEQLLEVLEQRDELSADNVTILKEWPVALKCFTIQPMLEQYEKLQDVYSKEQRCNVCQVVVEHNLKLPDPKPEKPVENKEKEATDNSEDLDDAFDAIAQHLGRSWKDLGRKFRLSEYDIQDIDDKEKRLVDRAYSVFTYWKEKAGNDATVMTLIQVLQKCRRKDLVDILTKGKP